MEATASATPIFDTTQNASQSFNPPDMLDLFPKLARTLNDAQLHKFVRCVVRDRAVEEQPNMDRAIASLPSTLYLSKSSIFPEACLRLLLWL